MGEPEYLSEKEMERLEEASQLVSEKQTLSFHHSTISLKVRLPPHAVAAITIEFKQP